MTTPRLGMTKLCRRFQSGLRRGGLVLSQFRRGFQIPGLGSFWLVCIGLCCVSSGSLCLADTILASKHDLSASGPGTIKATAESEVCSFCHTPHLGTGDTPLWSQ